jgi:DNA-directed RNA polymerase subunit N (RpoN/RPB10)
MDDDLSLPKYEPNQGTTYPLLPVRCHCAEPMGVFQEKFEAEITKVLEELRNSDLSQSQRLSEARKRALVVMGWTKMCCRTSATCYTFLPVHDGEGSQCRINSTTAPGRDGSVQNNYRSRTTGTPYGVYPKNGGQLPFDTDAYARRLYEIATGSAPEPDTKYPSFPLIQAERIPYPTVSASYPPPEFNPRSRNPQRK